MKLTRTVKILVLILIIGFILRFLGSSLMPLYGDELTLVYDAYSILKTGRDQNGVFLPLTFQMAEGRPAGYVYFSLPFVAAFGPTMLGARMLSILSGVGLIALVYILGRKLINDEVGLLGAALLSISPWGIQLGSGGFETHFALFLTSLGVVLFLEAKAKPYLLPLSVFFLGLAVHSYSTYKLTIPLLIIVLIFSAGQFRNWLGKKFALWTTTALVIIGLFGGLLINQALTAGSEGRFLHLNIFTQVDIKENIIQKINFERNIDTLPSFVIPLFHNKNLEYALFWGENYLRNFSADFLYFHGDANPRHNGATMGELYPLELVFVLFGLFFLFRDKHPALRLLLPWMALAPLPAALVGEPHALRNSLMLPPLILFSAVGAFRLWELFKARKLTWLAGLLVVIFLLQFLVFLDRFYFLAPNLFARFWSYPAKLATEVVKNRQDQFNYIIASDSLDNIEFAYPVYARVDPNIVVNQNLRRTFLGSYQFKKFDKVYIGHIPASDIERFINILNGSVLYLGPYEEAKFLQNYEVLSNKDGLPALVVKESIK